MFDHLLCDPLYHLGQRRRNQMIACVDARAARITFIDPLDLGWAVAAKLRIGLRREEESYERWLFREIKQLK